MVLSEKIKNKKLSQQTKKIIFDTCVGYYSCSLVGFSVSYYLTSSHCCLIIASYIPLCTKCDDGTELFCEFQAGLGLGKSSVSQPTFPITSSVLGLRYKLIMPLPIESLISIQINVWQYFQRAIRGFLLMEVLISENVITSLVK